MVAQNAQAQSVFVNQSTVSSVNIGGEGGEKNMYKLASVAAVVFLTLPLVAGAIQNGDFYYGDAYWQTYLETNCSATFYPYPDSDPHCRLLGARPGQTAEIYQAETGFNSGDTWRATFVIREVVGGMGSIQTVGWTDDIGAFFGNGLDISHAGTYTVDCNDASYYWVTVHAQGSPGIGVDSIIDVDEISTTRLATPTPTPTPTASPTARPGGSTMSDFTFSGSTEGWTASTSTGFSLPTTSWSGGAIALSSANDGVNRFGFWLSAPGGIAYEAGKVYVARYFIRTNQATLDNVPSMRLRWVAQGLEANAGAQILSQASFSDAPRLFAREYQSYFYPPATSPMNIAFDILDFGATEGGALYLDEAIVDKFDRPSSGTAVKTYDTAGDFSTWTFNPNFGGGFGNVASANWGTGSLSLMSSPSPSNDCTYITTPPHLYRATFRLSIGNDADRLSMCGIRMRIQNEDNQMTQTMEVTTYNGGVAMPYEAGTNYELYWATPYLPASPGTAEDGFFVAFDLLDFSNMEGGQVNLEKIDIEYF
jgi:hypothetical protein